MQYYLSSLLSLTCISHDITCEPHSFASLIKKDHSFSPAMTPPCTLSSQPPSKQWNTHNPSLMQTLGSKSLAPANYQRQRLRGLAPLPPTTIPCFARLKYCSTPLQFPTPSSLPFLFSLPFPTQITLSFSCLLRIL